MVSWRESLRPARAAATAGISTAAGHMPWSSAGGPGRIRIAGIDGVATASDVAGTATPGAVPTGGMACAFGNHRLLTDTGHGGRGQRIGAGAVHQCPDALGDPGLDGAVEGERTVAEPGDRGHGEIVGGRTEAAGGDDQVDLLIGEEAQLGGQVVRSVAADGDVRDVDTEVQELLGNPRSVPVGDPTRQHLGSGHDNARACTHPLKGSGHRPSCPGRRRRVLDPARPRPGLPRTPAPHPLRCR
ncbi:hypothetical protein GCM10009624_18190 [Gordonia sinesedis]